MFFVLEVGSHQVHILGVTRQPTGDWVTQQARNFLMTAGERAGGFRFLVRDREAKFTASLDEVFADAQIAVLRSPPRAPKANAYAERWISTVRREYLDRLLIVNERQPAPVTIEIGVSIRQHPTGSPARFGESDQDRFRAWDRPRGERA